MGDVNADGYADFVVGVPDADSGGFNRGQAHVHFGAAAPDGASEGVIFGAADLSRLGLSVSAAGDVDADGFADVFVGRPFGTAQALVYFGAAGASFDASSAGAILVGGGLAGDRFGESLAGAGDLNGDGFSDVIAGARLDDTGGLNRGAVFVFLFGARPLDTLADGSTFGSVDNEELGDTVAARDDVGAQLRWLLASRNRRYRERRVRPTGLRDKCPPLGW